MLKQRCYLEAKNNPDIIPTTEDHYRIPRWNLLRYIEHLTIYNYEEPDDVITGIIIDFIESVISDQIRNPYTDETIMKLHPVKFKYSDKWKSKHKNIENKYYYNFIAQEYKNVFPNSVKGSGQYLEGEKEEILQLDSYNAQIVAIKAIQELIIQNKEQQEIIYNLQKEVKKIENLQKEINKLKSFLETNTLIED